MNHTHSLPNREYASICTNSGRPPPKECIYQTHNPLTSSSKQYDFRAQAGRALTQVTVPARGRGHQRCVSHTFPMGAGNPGFSRVALALPSTWPKHLTPRAHVWKHQTCLLPEASPDSPAPVTIFLFRLGLPRHVASASPTPPPHPTPYKVITVYLLFPVSLMDHTLVRVTDTPPAGHATEAKGWSGMVLKLLLSLQLDQNQG